MILKDAFFDTIHAVVDWFSPPPKFLNEAQIADELFTKLDEKDRRYLAALPDKSDLLQFHHNVGMQIRNGYQLWNPKNPHTDLSDACAENFPDQVSQRVIERIWGKSRDWVSLHGG